MLQALDKDPPLLLVHKPTEELPIGRVLQLLCQCITKRQRAGVSLDRTVGIMGDIHHHRHDVLRQVKISGDQQDAGQQRVHDAQSIKMHHTALTLHATLQQVENLRLDVAA